MSKYIIWEASMLTDVYKGIHTKWTYFKEVLLFYIYHYQYELLENCSKNIWYGSEYMR